MTTTAGAYEQLRADILDGRHPAGTRLAPGELAAGLGCPPAHVGEALDLLAADGLVDGGDGDPRVVVWSARTCARSSACARSWRASPRPWPPRP